MGKCARGALCSHRWVERDAGIGWVRERRAIVAKDDWLRETVALAAGIKDARTDGKKKQTHATDGIWQMLRGAGVGRLALLWRRLACSSSLDCGRMLSMGIRRDSAAEM